MTERIVNLGEVVEVWAYFRKVKGTVSQITPVVPGRNMKGGHIYSISPNEDGVPGPILVLDENVLAVRRNGSWIKLRETV